MSYKPYCPICRGTRDDGHRCPESSDAARRAKPLADHHILTDIALAAGLKGNVYPEGPYLDLLGHHALYPFSNLADAYTLVEMCRRPEEPLSVLICTTKSISAEVVFGGRPTRHPKWCVGDSPARAVTNALHDALCPDERRYNAVAERMEGESYE